MSTTLSRFLIFVVVLLLVERGFGAVAETIVVTCEPEGKEFFPGEPCVINVKIKNVSDAAVKLDLGWNAYGSFWVELYKDEGGLEASSKPIPPQAGLSRPGEVDVAGQDSLGMRLILNRWISTDRKAGQYTMQLHFKGPNGEVTAKSQLVIKEKNPAVLETIFGNLAKSVLDKKSSVEARNFAAEELTISNVPEAVSAIRMVLAASGTKEGIDYAPLALKALGNIGTPQAAQTLAAFVAKTDAIPEQRNQAIAALYALQDRFRDRKDVVEICTGVTSRFPRPILAEPGD
jgi:hypothetical protein